MCILCSRLCGVLIISVLFICVVLLYMCLVHLLYSYVCFFYYIDLQYASPATISRCGMVWVDPKNLGFSPFYEKWVRDRYSAYASGVGPGGGAGGSAADVELGGGVGDVSEASRVQAELLMILFDKVGISSIFS